MTTLNSNVTAATYDEVLQFARQALTGAEQRRDRLKLQADRAAQPISDDPAIGSGIRRRSTARQIRRDDAKTDRDLQTYNEYLQAEKQVYACQARVDRLVAAAPVPYTDEELRAATAVRTELGWYWLLKVNRKTVAVDAGFPWPHKVARELVLEVRAGGAA